MVILGLDIGYDRCGVCIYEDEKIIFSGLIVTDKKDPIQKRLKILRQDLLEIKNQFNPDCVGIEKLFFNRRNSVFEKICMSKGVALELFSGCVVEEIEPKKIKKEMIGSGDADKSMVKLALSKMLKLNLDEYMDDVVDAIAIAIYMSQKIKLEKLYNQKK